MVDAPLVVFLHAQTREVQHGAAQLGAAGRRVIHFVELVREAVHIVNLLRMLVRLDVRVVRVPMRGDGKDGFRLSVGGDDVVADPPEFARFAVVRKRQHGAAVADEYGGHSFRHDNPRFCCWAVGIFLILRNVPCRAVRVDTDLWPYLVRFGIPWPGIDVAVGIGVPVCATVRDPGMNGKGRMRYGEG